MALITVEDTQHELSPRHHEQLEGGDILFFPGTPIEMGEGDLQCLLGQRQTDATYHKNIAYRPAQDLLTGVARGGDCERLRRILRGYYQQTEEVLRRLLPRYARDAKTDFTSFRPFEEAGRDRPLHSRNDLLHVDAFPTRPTHGDRILRFFTNINPSQARVWYTSDPFPKLAERFAQEAGLVHLGRRMSAPWRKGLAKVAAAARLRHFTRSPYDALMHRFHNFLKENRQFQESCRKQRWEFPPGSSWLVFTDMVSHAVLSGQYALEQTFIISRQAMVTPQQAPISVLERLAGRPLSWGG